MKAPGYRWLTYGAYVLFLGGLICSAFAWLAVLNPNLGDIRTVTVLIYSLQGILALFAGVDSIRSRNSKARARNCVVDAICVFALNIIVIVQIGFSWYLLLPLAGAVLVGIGGYMNYRTK